MRRAAALVLAAAVGVACSPLRGEQATKTAPTTATVGATAPAAERPARYAPTVSRLRGEIRREVASRNWHPGCPVGLDDLRVVEIGYWGFDGRVRRGPLVVHRRVADDVAQVFRRLFRARFPIKHVALPARSRPRRPGDAGRTRSITAAFNCRPVVEGTGWSQHAYGWAIDVNPIQNPYVRANGTPIGRPSRRYLDRTQDLPGMIHDGDVVVRAFARIGWSWGGHWSTIRDYMHFSLTGR